MAKKEVGEFGTIYTQLKKRPKEAIIRRKLKNVRYCPKVKRGINFTDRPVPYPTNAAKLNKINTKTK